MALSRPSPSDVAGASPGSRGTPQRATPPNGYGGVRGRPGEGVRAVLVQENERLLPLVSRHSPALPPACTTPLGIHHSSLACDLKDFVPSQVSERVQPSSEPEWIKLPKGSFPANPQARFLSECYTCQIPDPTLKAIPFAIACFLQSRAQSA